MSIKKGFLILDFGSQYTWLIARSFRELGFYSQVEAFDIPLEDIKKLSPTGIVLSGGPSSVLSQGAPSRNLKALLEIAPLMGICYGLQLLCHQWGGEITPFAVEEGGAEPKTGGAYGASVLKWNTKKIINREYQKVWMSHGDLLSKIPKGFSVLAQTEQKTPAVLKANNILALQFHPEVAHTQDGKKILSYFASTMCGAQKKSWTPTTLLSLLETQIKTKFPLTAKSKTTGSRGSATILNNHPLVAKSKTAKKGVKTPIKTPVKGQILCALSGGVDSTVMACLLTKVLGANQVRCVFVDTGLLRKNEYQEVLSAYQKMGLNVKGLMAETRFLSALKGIEDPEQKRKVIGRLFIDIFKDYKGKNPSIKYLAQGTLYPDVIESVGIKGPSHTIKSHHNVGGLPKNMPFKLLEPLKLLFKDEVRVLGKQLKIPPTLLTRHPFPGPGLAVRICGPITKERVQKLKEADAIFMEELKKAGLYNKIWQAFAVLLPIKSVGVQGDRRTYEEAIALRAITSTDGMTADWFDFPAPFLKKVSNHITNKVTGINRVVYDITSKPPGTIEWL